MNYANKGLGYSQKSLVLCYFHCTELRTEHINHKSHRRHCCIPACWWLCLNIYISDSKKAHHCFAAQHTIYFQLWWGAVGDGVQHNPVFTTPLDFSNKMSQWWGWREIILGENLEILENLPVWLFSDWTIRAAIDELGFNLLPYIWDGAWLREDPDSVLA